MSLNIEPISKEQLIRNLCLRKCLIYKHFLADPDSLGLAFLLLRFPSESHLRRMSYERLLRWEKRLSRIEDS